jgi:hypothetical protein
MDLVTVTECQSQFDAQLVVNHLEANGVRAYISGGALSSTALTRGVPCGVLIQVAKSDADKVTKLLKERSDDSTKPGAAKNWAEKTQIGVAWFVVAVIVLGLLVPLIGWLLGRN